MRKLVVSEFVSLDGIVEDPRWTFQFESEERNQFKFDELAASDALLLGRVTYEGFAAAWPQRDENDPATGAKYFNNVKKYVASTTLTDPTWNNTEVLQGDLVEAVTKLKAQDGKDIIQYGFGTVTAQLIRAGLVDEVRFWIHPVLEGGTTVTAPLADFKASFDLVDTRVMKSGTIIASYRPKTER